MPPGRGGSREKTVSNGSAAWNDDTIMGIMLAVFLALALQGPAVVRGDRGTVEWGGSVVKATPLPAGAGVVIALAPVDANTGLRPPHAIRVAFPEIPSPYRSVLNQAPRRLLSEPIQGRLARVHAYVDDRGTQVVAIE